MKIILFTPDWYVKRAMTHHFLKLHQTVLKNASHQEPFAQNTDPHQILSPNVEMGYLALRLRFLYPFRYAGNPLNLD